MPFYLVNFWRKSVKTIDGCFLAKMQLSMVFLCLFSSKKVKISNGKLWAKQNFEASKTFIHTKANKQILKRASKFIRRLRDVDMFFKQKMVNINQILDQGIFQVRAEECACYFWHHVFKVLKKSSFFHVFNMSKIVFGFLNTIDMFCLFKWKLSNII